RHAHAHDEFNAILRAQGYDVDKFLASYKKWSTRIEKRTSPELRLAVTAACEHFTAIMAEGAFTRGVLDEAAPEMRLLLAWHAAEEIEHKAVAFDVLQIVDPRYRTRVLGLVLATLTLGGFWAWGAASLMRQDGLTGRKALKEVNAQRRTDPMIRRVFVRGIRQYLRRDFHPNQNNDRALAAEWFAARGMTLPEPAHAAAPAA
ncbi:MAG: metal-dependent hydrolase, partial [Kofleriaceae bacterium]